MRARAGLTERVQEGLEDFFPESSVSRVQKSLEWLIKDREFVKNWERGQQVATSFIAGLTAEPFHDPHTSKLDLKWWLHLEQHAATIREEFLSVCADEAKLSQGNSVWVPAVDKNALKYGGDWRTLVLQDRGRWEPQNSKLFPKTTQIVKDSRAPSLEVFFARQPARTGIEPHTDNSNFVMTGHLALVVPEGDCWIKSGNEVAKWKKGKCLVMDTSFIHSTANNTDGDRYVLIIRFFHPELSQMERLALQYIFDATDAQDAKAAKKQLQKAFKTMGIRRRL